MDILVTNSTPPDNNILFFSVFIPLLTHGFHTSTSINIPHNINWGNKINHVTNITKRKEGREGEWEVNSTHTKSTYIFTKFISKMNRITFII